MGCTEAELLDVAAGRRRTAARSTPLPGPGRRSPSTAARSSWPGTALPPRQIALMRMPRMAVRFRFEGVDEAPRQRFMRYFDLYTQRGGG